MWGVLCARCYVSLVWSYVFFNPENHRYHFSFHFLFTKYLLSIYYEQVLGTSNKGNKGEESLIVEFVFQWGERNKSTDNDKASVF